MDDLFDEWEGIDWGSTPSVDTSFDLGGLDLSGISLDTPYFDLGDTGTLLNGIDLSGLDFSGLDLSGIGLDNLYQDLGDTGTLLGGIDGGTLGTEGFAGALDTPGYVYGTEGFADAADEVGGAGGYDEEALKDQFWKETLGTGTAVPGTGVLTTNEKGQTVIKYGDGTTKVIDDTKTNTIQDTIKKITDTLKNPTGTGDKTSNAMLYALLGGLMGLLSKGSAPKGPVGYQGGIPKYTATRVPGRGVEYTRAAQGGLMGLSDKEHPIKAAKGGQYLKGSSDGMADDIYTSIDGKQPARLSSGEFVVSADVVSALGSGNSDAGADVLYDMMDRVRKNAYGRKKQIAPVNKRKVLPA